MNYRSFFLIQCEYENFLTIHIKIGQSSSRQLPMMREIYFYTLPLTLQILDKQYKYVFSIASALISSQGLYFCILSLLH